MAWAMASDIPNLSKQRKCRAGDRHVALIARKEVATERAQWRHSKMKLKIDALFREDPVAPFVAERGRGRCYLRGLPKSAIVFWGRN